MRLAKKVRILLLVAITTSNIYSGLPPQTMVFMGNGIYKWAKDLRVGDHIPIYDIPNDQLDSRKRKIQGMLTRKTKDLILIKTKNDGFIAVGPNQKLFNRKIKKFIPAEDFEIGDELFSPEKGALTITDIENKESDSDIELYDVTLEGGNIFLILTTQKTHILAHNFAQAAPIAASGFGIRLVVGGVTAAVASISRFLTSPVSPGPIKPDPKNKNKKNDKDKKKACQYQDITKPGSIPNTQIDLTRKEFEDSLQQNDWNKTFTQDGKGTIYEKDGARYVVRDAARSTGGPTADYYSPGSGAIDAKIRLVKE